MDKTSSGPAIKWKLIYKRLPEIFVYSAYFNLPYNTKNIKIQSRIKLILINLLVEIHGLKPFYINFSNVFPPNTHPVNSSSRPV